MSNRNNKLELLGNGNLEKERKASYWVLADKAFVSCL